MVTIAINMVLYTWKLLRVDFKNSHHTNIHTLKLIIWGDRYIKYLALGNHPTVSHYRLQIYAIIFVNYSSKCWGKIKNGKVVLYRIYSLELLVLKESLSYTWLQSSCGKKCIEVFFSVWETWVELPAQECADEIWASLCKEILFLSL